MPNRNDKKYLPEAINSVLNQKIKVDEFLIIDDFSNDSSVAIIKENIKDTAYARLIENKINLGVMEVLNQGLGAITSDYVLFLASNDFIHENFTNEVHQAIAEKSFKEVGIISGLSKKTDKFGNDRINYSILIRLSVSYLEPCECSKILNKVGPWFMGNSMLFNVKKLRQIDGFNVQYKGLADLYSACILAENNGALFIPKTLGSIRQHEDGYLQNTLKNTDEIIQKMSIEIEKQGIKNIVSSDMRIFQFKKLIKFNSERNTILLSGNKKIICNVKILHSLIKNYGFKLIYHFYYRKIKWLLLKY